MIYEDTVALIGVPYSSDVSLKAFIPQFGLELSKNDVNCDSISLTSS